MRHRTRHKGLETETKGTVTSMSLESASDTVSIDGWVERCIGRIQSAPKLVLSVIAIITTLFAFQAINLEINATPYLLAKEHPSRVLNSESKLLFTNMNETALVALVTEESTIVNRHSLNTLKTLTNQFIDIDLLGNYVDINLDDFILDDRSQYLAGLVHEATTKNQASTNLKALRDHLLSLNLLSENRVSDNRVSDNKMSVLNDLVVKADPVKRVRSLLTEEGLIAQGDMISIQPLVEVIPHDNIGMRALEEELMSNPLIMGNYLSESGLASSIQIELNISEDDSPNMVMLHQSIENIISKTDTVDAVHLSGSPIVSAATASTVERDNNRLFPFVILVIGLLLAVSFRRFQGVYLPLLVAVISIIWTTGIMVILGVKQNIVTAMLPVFLISIAITDSVHVLSSFRQKREQASDHALVATFQQLLLPLVMTTLTTMVGFMALAQSNIIFVSEFGLFVSIGVFIALALTLTLTPAMLALSSRREPSTSTKALPPSHRRASFFRQGFISKTFISNTAISFQQHNTAVIGTFMLLGALSVFGILALNVDNQAIGYFSVDSRIRLDTREINRHFGGSTPINLLFTGFGDKAGEGTFKKPEVVKALAKISEEISVIEGVGYVSSVSNLIKRANQVLNEGGYNIPENITQETIAQYYLFYENATNQELNDLVDFRYLHSRIFISVASDKASEVRRIIEEVERISKRLLPDYIKVNTTGYGEIIVAVTDEVIQSQVVSMASACVVIFFIMLALFRSFVYALLAMVPLLMTVTVTFAIMGYVGLPLDIGTSLVASIALGIGVDYSIHFFGHLNNALYKLGLELENAVIWTLNEIARPIMITSTVMTFGFLVLTLSDYTAIVRFGLMVSGSMILSALFTLLLLPALVRLCKQAFERS